MNGIMVFVSIWLGAQEVGNLGPFEYRGALEQQRQIVADIDSADRPFGYTDGTGAIYLKDDWDVRVERCRASECEGLMRVRRLAIQAYQERR